MIEEKTVQYAKELDDVMVLVHEIVRAIKNKEGYTSLIDDLVKAVNGIDEIDDEIENIEAVINTVCARMYQIVNLFLREKK